LQFELQRRAAHNGEMAYPVNVHAAYHAHVYFDASTVPQARALCEEAGRLFGVQAGRVHEKLVGPHPRWSCQLAFDTGQFDAVVPWLDAHRQGLDVFVHGLSGNDLEDHTTHAYWLGTAWPLNLAMFLRADASRG
jgi:aromatic ring-cleaving dioxygenase